MFGIINCEEISVVIQGPIHKNYTSRCIKSVRELLPGAEVVLSTWRGSQTQHLSYNKLVLNDDPGGIELSEFSPGVQPNNVNRQITSTLNGLNVATKKYALKIRTDTVLVNTNFRNYFGKFSSRATEVRILDERVVVTGAISPRRSNRCFHVNDFAYFGLREDLIKIWDLQLSPTIKDVKEKSLNYESTLLPVAECYLWVSFLRKFIDVRFKHASDHNLENVELTELSIANNLVLTDLNEFGIKILTHPTWHYMLFDPYSVNWAYRCCFSDWLQWYKKYCEPEFDIPKEAEYEVLEKARYIVNLLNIAKQISPQEEVSYYTMIWSIENQYNLKGENYLRQFGLFSDYLGVCKNILDEMARVNTLIEKAVSRNSIDETISLLRQLRNLFPIVDYISQIIALQGYETLKNLSERLINVSSEIISYFEQDNINCGFSLFKSEFVPLYKSIQHEIISVVQEEVSFN